MARHRFGEAEAMFRSAGFLTEDEACPEHLLRALGELGVDASQHRSYRIDPASLEAADLVLTMEGQHVPSATRLHRAAFPKIMPLKEAARVATGLGPRVSLDDLVDEVNRMRDPRTYLSKGWDVADPYRRKLRDYRRAVAEIDGLVAEVMDRIV
ncbi:MAG: hypothetical protein R2761_01945 [Acidimicrobiales bacterium]